MKQSRKQAPKQLKLFEPLVIKKAALISESPRSAFYNLWLEMFMGNYSVRKESGCSNKVLDRRCWKCESPEKAEKFFNRLLRNKTNPKRRSPRKYHPLSASK